MKTRKGLKAQTRDWNYVTRELKKEIKYTHIDDSGVFKCPLGSTCEEFKNENVKST